MFVPVADQTLQNYQYRIGGRYFPASPVQCSVSPSSSVTNGGAEAFCELQKCLNTVGDYRLSSGVNTARWATPSNTSADSSGNPSGMELDYTTGGTYFTNNGSMIAHAYLDPGAGEIGSGCFAMATCLETSNGLEISGLNAEEQSDISFQANYSSGALTTGMASIPYIVEAYTYYDAMLVLRENNVVELIQ